MVDLARVSFILATAAIDPDDEEIEKSVPAASPSFASS